MRLATGTIASLVLTIGALMLLVAGASSESVIAKTSNLRGRSSRKLYNYSRNNNGSYSSYRSSSYSNGGSYGGNDGSDDYGGSYGSYGSDDGVSNYNAQADGSSYNGRDQNWGGESVQSYTDDEEPEVYVEEYSEDSKFNILGKFGGLSGMETLSVIGLILMGTLMVLTMIALANGFNVIHLCQVYCFRGVFGHTDQKTGDAPEGSFVKLDEA